MKMRYAGRSVSNRHCEILLELESGQFDMHKVLRCARDASKKMDLDPYVKYLARVKQGRDPHVYVKYADKQGIVRYGYILIRDTMEEGQKKILITTNGFKRENLDVLADLILEELRVSGDRSTQQESQPCQHEQLDLFQPGR
jgi:hypothetical protein